MNQRKKTDPIDEALRNEPDYQELVRNLKRQTPLERERFDEWIEDEEQREEHPDVSEKDPQDA